MEFPRTPWSEFRRRKDDTSRLRSLVAERYANALQRYVQLEWGLSAHDTQDLAQEVWLEMCKGDWLESADPSKGTFHDLLQKVTDHVVSSRFRYKYAKKRDFRREEPLAGQEGRVQASPPTFHGSYFFPELIKAALAEMGDDPKVPALRLWLMSRSGEEPLTYDEIGKRLSKSPQDVNNDISRAKKEFAHALRQLVQEYSESSDEYEAEIDRLLRIMRSR